MAKNYDIEPRITGDVTFGDRRKATVIYGGKLAEKGPGGRVLFDASDNFVVLEVGKRGSGKSYGMGAFLEGFAVGPKSKVTTGDGRRGVLLLDPLDIHWTAILPLRADGPELMRRQHALLQGWAGLEAEPINATAWFPAGFRWQTDHAAFRDYYVPVSALDADDWAVLLQTDLILQPRGRLIDEALQKVTALGWDRNGICQKPRLDYSIDDLLECISADADIATSYAPETIRSVAQPLKSYARMPLFSQREGTPITELVQAGNLAILSLGRLGADLRTVVATVVVRKLHKERMVASQIARRLNLQQLTPSDKESFQAELDRRVGRAVLAIDEAQILMPQSSQSPARKALESFVLEGRNHGLSLWLATQRPKGAISDAAISQVDTFIVHRLSVSDDISAVSALLQNSKPDKIRGPNNSSMEIPDLIRSLDVGQAVISSAVSDASRFFVASIRPRLVAHGGDAL